MSARLKLLVMRFARGLMARILRRWPEESHEWGMALTAEMEEITGMWDALRWSLGGVMLFVRSVASEFFSWMKLPAGASLRSNGNTNHSFRLKRSRIFTVSVLAVAGALFVLPQTRQAITTLRASWNEFQPSSADRRALERLATRAEKDNDAAVLAFVALRMDDSDRFATLANRAVTLDPQLVWIYAGARGDWKTGRPVPEEELQRMLAADPGNAVPKLLAAQRMKKPDFAELYYPLSLKNIRAEKLQECCPQWVAQMEQAFAAPHYDSYSQQHFLLTTSIWSREKSLSPSLTLIALWTRLPNLMDLRAFSDIRILQAREAFAAGSVPEAQRHLVNVDSFGQRMYDGSSTAIEKLIGLAISYNANEQLRKVYEATANTAEATKTNLRLQDLKQLQGNLRPAYRKQIPHTWGIALNVFALLAILAGTVALLAIVLLELRPAGSVARACWHRKVLCWTADHAPAVLLLSGVAFVFCFLPYAEVFAEYRSSNNAFSHEQLSSALMSLMMIPRYLFGFKSAVVLWYAVIVVLAALALFVLGTSAYRSSHARANRA
jgi:hypothetical protein